jgi:RNA-directed DNA polymerase
LEAVGVARERCWRYAWVLDLDIRAFFDTLPHDLLLRAVRKHTDCHWVLLYIERWLKAPPCSWKTAPWSLGRRERRRGQ